MSPRVVAVLGYSERSRPGLHRICAERLERASELARPDDIVVLSGWARGGSNDSEAELMRRAWRGEAAFVICDHSRGQPPRMPWRSRRSSRNTAPARCSSSPPPGTRREPGCSSAPHWGRASTSTSPLQAIRSPCDRCFARSCAGRSFRFSSHSPAAERARVESGWSRLNCRGSACTSCRSRTSRGRCGRCSRAPT